jgi:excinuclease UvrABC nuclease subunit
MTRARQPKLSKDLRDFASGRPEGWNHDDWLAFLESLQSRGHNIEDREAIGLALERERLDLALSGVKGVGPQRKKALIERYGNVWNLRNADPAEIAAVGNLPRPLAEQVKLAM